MKKLIDLLDPRFGSLGDNLILQSSNLKVAPSMGPTKGEDNSVVSFRIRLIGRVPINQKHSLDEGSQL
jgi:hypothetical protein